MKQSEKSINHEWGDVAWAFTNHKSITAALSLSNAIIISPEICDHNTTDSSWEWHILFPVLVFSVFFDFVLEVWDIAVSKHHVGCFNEVVHWDVKLHSIGRNIDLYVIEHSEERENKWNQTSMAWAREVGNDTIDDSSEDWLDVESLLGFSQFWFCICIEILLANKSTALCRIHLMVS